MVAPDRLQLGIGLVFEEPPRRPPVLASASGGRRPPELPPTALIDDMPPDRPERDRPGLLGEEGYRDLLRLWRRSPQSTDRSLHQVLIGTSLSVYAVPTLELIAESQWTHRRSPNSIVPLRANGLKEHVMGVFCFPTPDLELETSLYRIASTNPNRCLGLEVGLGVILTIWDAWMDQTRRMGYR